MVALALISHAVSTTVSSNVKSDLGPATSKWKHRPHAHSVSIWTSFTSESSDWVFLCSGMKKCISVTKKEIPNMIIDINPHSHLSISV